MFQKLSSQISNTVIVIAFLTALSATILSCQGNKQKQIILTTGEWNTVTEQAGDVLDSFNYKVTGKDGGMEFSISGNPGSSRTVRWTKEIDVLKLDDFSYISIDYQANFLNNPIGEVVGLSFIDNNGETNDIKLLKTMDLIVDGRPHNIIVKNHISGSLKKLIVQLNTRSSKAYFLIKSFGIIKSETEFSDCISYKIQRKKDDKSLQFIDLTDRYNASFAEVQKEMLNTNPFINDGGKYFTGSEIEIDGIPFQVKPEGMNLLSFPPESKVNEDTISHFGNKVRRGSVAPISRDDVIEVNVNSAACEVYFLLAAEHPRKCLTDPTYLTYIMEDIETFAVELLYEDGTIDLAFPFSIRDQKHIIQGTVGAYVVPTSGKSLKKILFHNRTLGKNFYLGAVTVNNSQTRLFPLLFAEPGPKAMQESKIPNPAIVSPYLEYKNGILKAGNTFVEMTIDAQNSFTITGFTNKWLDEKAITINPTPGFQVAIDQNKLDIKDIRLLSVSDVSGTIGKEITLNYGLKTTGGNLEINILVSVSNEPEIGLQMTAINTSQQDFKAQVVFPILNGVQLGEAEDSWYYYPSYRNVFSNQNITLDHIYSLSFPYQFYDVFNPVLGGGFYLATRETDVNEMRRYGFQKSESGMNCYIEYPKLHTLLKSNVPDTLCKTVLGVHTGDWHAAFDTYKRWLSGWYKPVNSQDKQWYREYFWLLCEYPDNIPYELLFMHKSFTWYDTINQHYRMRDILEEHKRTVGRNPDILHFWSWQQNMPVGYKRWGAYGTNGEYEKMGGVNNFKLAISDIKKNIGVNMSIYIDASLCNRDIPIAKQIGPDAAMQLASGGSVIDYDSYRMCPGAKAWRDYMQKVYQRVHKDLDISILYVDEWAPPMYNGHVALPAFTCYSSEHGHAVPANLNLEVNTYMRELRNAVTAKAALYGEYPDVDVNTKYYDSNITYYLSTYGTELKDGRDNIGYDIDMKDNGLSDPYISLHKFAFPGLIQLVLPNDAFNYSWNRLKFTFLNGDALYDNFWVRDESKAEAFMIKSYDIKKKYADCFTSDLPEPLVLTEKSGIMANKFPGIGRTIWTLYNQRFTTVRGEIMKVKHIEGASYYDVWNDKPLQVRISGDYAFLSLEMYPQSIGCIVQKFK